ncbi:MAG: hypothetical protein ABL864_02285 [Terricaulis sp.]|jgi:predicted DNA-binding transcriptional regulator AlpA
MSEELIPHKTMLTRLGLSRTGVWRALHSAIQGFPTPRIVRRRVYWRVQDLPLLAASMERYCGRGEFDKARRVNKLIKKSGSKAEKSVKGKRKRKAKQGEDRHQLDLFGRT